MKKTDFRLYSATTNGFVVINKASMKNTKNGLQSKRPWIQFNSSEKSGVKKKQTMKKDTNTERQFSKKSLSTENQKCKKDDQFKKPNAEMGKCTKVILYACVTMLPFSLMLIVVAMATPFWFDTGNATFGLFQICQGVPNSCINVMDYLPTSTATNTWLVVIGLETSGAVLLLLGTLAILCIYPSCSFGDRRTVVFGVLVSFVILMAAVFINSGVYMMVLFSVNHAVYRLSWSLYLAVCGAGLTFLSFCFIVTFVCLTVFR